MSTKDDTEAAVNLKMKNASHMFRITIRDRDHFYKVVNWLNDNVGKGAQFWTMEGRRILKRLNMGSTASPMIYIFKDDFDSSSSVYLTLL